jgi:hypothetical protein
LYGYNTNGAFDIEGNIVMGKVMGCDALGQLIVDINGNDHYYSHGSIKQFIA